MNRKQTIVLLGMPGSGKSTLGQVLAQKLGLPFVDLDSLLEQEAGCSIPVLFEQKGESYFRQLESSLLKKVLEAPVPVVLATGGGAPCFFDNMAAIRQHAQSVYLELSWALLARRLAQEPGDRPLLKGLTGESQEAALQEKFGWRIPFYQQAECRLLVAEGQGVEALAELLLQKLSP